MKRFLVRASMWSGLALLLALVMPPRIARESAQTLQRLKMRAAA